LRLRLGEEKALHPVAILFFKQGKLLRSFDAFRNHVHRECMGQSDHRIDNCRIISLCIEIFDETAIDLEGLNRKLFQITQR